jgi:asparagine synthase (glutamine-hydrolysing)
MTGTSASPIITTSIGFDEEADSELRPAGMTAKHFRTTHYPETVHPNLAEIFDRVVLAFDEPFADSSAIPTYYVCGLSRRHVTVALSGDGGDESFAGYDFRYGPHAVESSVRRLIPRFATPIVRGLGRHWPRHASLPRALRLGTILENVASDAATAYYSDLCFLKPRQAQWLAGREESVDFRRSETFVKVTDPYRRCPSKDAVQRAEYADLKIYLPNDVLVKVDRMSMLHSLEVRCPFLDRQMVEFAFRVPASKKMARREGKHLLRMLARERLPPALATMPKRGFTAPVGRWMAGQWRAQCAEDLFSTEARLDACLDVRRLRILFQQHSEGTHDHSYALWACWMLAKWRRLTPPFQKELKRRPTRTVDWLSLPAPLVH